MKINYSILGIFLFPFILQAQTVFSAEDNNIYSGNARTGEIESFNPPGELNLLPFDSSGSGGGAAAPNLPGSSLYQVSSKVFPIGSSLLITNKQNKSIEAKVVTNSDVNSDILVLLSPRAGRVLGIPEDFSRPITVKVLQENSSTSSTSTSTNNYANGGGSAGGTAPNGGRPPLFEDGFLSGDRSFSDGFGGDALPGGRLTPQKIEELTKTSTPPPAPPVKKEVSRDSAERPSVSPGSSSSASSAAPLVSVVPPPKEPEPALVEDIDNGDIDADADVGEIPEPAAPKKDSVDRAPGLVLEEKKDGGIRLDEEASTESDEEALKRFFLKPSDLRPPREEKKAPVLRKRHKSRKKIVSDMPMIKILPPPPSRPPRPSHPVVSELPRRPKSFLDRYRIRPSGVPRKFVQIGAYVKDRGVREALQKALAGYPRRSFIYTLEINGREMTKILVGPGNSAELGLLQKELRREYPKAFIYTLQ